MTASTGADLVSAPVRSRRNLIDLAASTATIAESIARIAAAALAVHALRTTRSCTGKKP